jgi:hypothetical protein
MDGDRRYSVRTRSSAAAAGSTGNRATSTGWTTTSSTSTTTRRSSVASPGMRTPEPVQRTLDLRALGAFEEDEDGFEALSRPTYRSSLYREHEDDEEDDEEDDSEDMDEEDDEDDEGELMDEEEEEEEGERRSLRTRRSTLKRRAASAAAFFNHRSAIAGRTCREDASTVARSLPNRQAGPFVLVVAGISQQVASWPLVKKLSKNFRRFWVSGLAVLGCDGL